MTLKVFEAFAGVGTQRMALDNIGVDHEVVAISEIDPHAIQTYMAVHGDTLNLGDISQIETSDIPDHDLFTYSFPCQDISMAGTRQGFQKDSGTRSSLLWECEKVIDVKRPKYLLMENVRALINEGNQPHFWEWLNVLYNYGYTSYTQVLNAKDLNHPHNRERVFVLSILGDHIPYVHPFSKQPTKTLKDILEYKVDDKYYLDKDDEREVIENVRTKQREMGKHYPGEESDTEWVIPAIIDNNYSGSRLPRIYTKYAPTLTASKASELKVMEMVDGANKIRFITPREAWRFTGVSDECFDRAQTVTSDAQLYKQAGNAIVVQVLEEIFKALQETVV